MSESKTIRPTKKQQEILAFIDAFIVQNGYSPSYREIVAGTNHSSVATVAVHINNLIKRGHLTKRDNSARSLELTKPTDTTTKVAVKQLNENQAKWLVEKVEAYFKEAENSLELSTNEVDKLYVLVGSLKILGLEGAAQAYMPRLNELKLKLRNKEGKLYA